MNDALITKLRFRFALWCDARLLPFRIWRERPLAEVLLLARPLRGQSYPNLPTDYILKHVLRTTRRPILMRDRRCLRQGILAFRFMTAAGYTPELHFGIDRTSLAGPVRAHCWLVHEGKVVLNPPDPATTRILVHTTKLPHETRPRWHERVSI